MSCKECGYDLCFHGIVEALKFLGEKIEYNSELKSIVPMTKVWLKPDNLEDAKKLIKRDLK